MSKKDVWVGRCDLCFSRRSPGDCLTLHKSSFNAPFKLMKAISHKDGRCEIPILHTAGGLIGGDELILNVKSEKKSSALMTTVAAQKVYGTVGRSKIHPEGAYAKQVCNFSIEEGGDLEWIPQELVMFDGALFEQCTRVQLALEASFLSAEVVRLGRTASGETLGNGAWRSKVEIIRKTRHSSNWEFVDQLELSGNSLTSEHGLSSNPVFGSLIWIAPSQFERKQIDQLVNDCRSLRKNLSGTMSCTALNKGISARYLGESTQQARFWFLRIWSAIRKGRGLSTPEEIRFWPLQENN